MSHAVPPAPARRLHAAVPLALIAALAAALVLPAFLHAVEVWSADEEFNYGFLIPVVSLGLLWHRRAAITGAVRDPSGAGAAWGLALVFGALALTLFSRRSGINVIAGVAVLPLLWGITLYMWGWTALRVLSFPIGFLFFGLGLYRGLLGSVGFALQQITAHGAEWSGRAVGLPVVRDGVLLMSDRFTFIVAEACSGMSSLLSLLALAALWTSFAAGRLPARAAVVLGVLPLVLLANTVRVTLVLVVAWWFGQDAALGFFHGASSLVLFGVALAGLLVLSRVVGCRLTFAGLEPGRGAA